MPLGKSFFKTIMKTEHNERTRMTALIKQNWQHRSNKGTARNQPPDTYNTTRAQPLRYHTLYLLTWSSRGLQPATPYLSVQLEAHLAVLHCAVHYNQLVMPVQSCKY